MVTQKRFRLIQSFMVGLTFGASLLAYSATEKVKLEGKIAIDGSSTVGPVTEAVAEEFQKVQPDVRVTVAVSGTGGGFKRFTVGEIDINNASRPIKDSESKDAKTHGVGYLELPVGYDGLSVVVNPKNTWVDHLTVEELHQIWKPESEVTTWNQVRKNWPAEKIKLYGPGTASGTFDFFTETVNGKAQASRSDFTKSEDDNALVMGVAGDKNSLGYFGFAYYMRNKSKLKVIPIINKTGKAVAPTHDSILTGDYSPLSRPLYIYVSDKATRRPEVRAFIDFYLTKAAELMESVGYVKLPKQKYTEGVTKFKKFASG